MALAGDVLPQPEVLGSEAVDGTIRQLDVDLSADHRHPTSPRCGMKVRKLGWRIHLQGASRAGLQGFQDGVVLAEFLYHALAVRPSIHAIDAHSFSSVASLVHMVVADLCREAAASPTPPPLGEVHHSMGPRCMLPRRLPLIVTHQSAGRYCITS